MTYDAPRITANQALGLDSFGRPKGEVFSAGWAESPSQNKEYTLVGCLEWEGFEWQGGFTRNRPISRSKNLLDGSVKFCFKIDSSNIQRIDAEAQRFLDSHGSVGEIAPTSGCSGGPILSIVLEKYSWDYTPVGVICALSYPEENNGLYRLWGVSINAIQRSDGTIKND